MNAFICDAIRTPIGRFGGALSSIRADDLAALSIKELKERNTSIDWSMVDEVIFGCANQSGEDNRNIARMSLLLAGLPQTVPGITINRLCASGLEAVTYASRMIKSNEAHLIIAGGVESMSRAPFVIPKSTTPFSRNAEIYDTTIGWRFINPIMRQMYGVESMPETAENVAERWNISREDQDKFAYWSQKKAAEAISKGRFDTEIFKVKIIQKKEENFLDKDEHPRSDTLLEKLSTLPTPFRNNGTVTAGNASGVNDGSAALIIASEKAIKDLGDKADKSDVDSTNKAIEDLREAIKTDEIEKIKDQTMKLTEVAGKIAQQAYQEQAQAAGETTQGADGNENANPSNKDAVDAEFQEVEDSQDEPKENTK